MSLAIDGLSADYGRLSVLERVSIASIARGQFVGVIGPNAAGKSTLFRAIAGLLAPAAGRLLLDGEDLARLGRRERAGRVAYMPQAFGCNAILTVFESVLLALKQTSGWRVSADDLGRVSRTLADLRLAHLSERGLSQLSGGQAQMVAVAQVLVRDPSVVLLDEPTSALDLHHQLSILGAIRRETRARGRIVLAALHDLNLAAEFCDRLILIRKGRLIADGRPADILARAEIGQTYRVEVVLERTRRGSLYVDASLGDHG